MTKNAPANVGLLHTNPVQRLQSFHPDFRDDIQKFVTKFSAACDLAEAFPGLLFALSTGAAKPSERNKAKRALASGAPLKKVAEAIKLPWWMRRLPASAFVEPMVSFPDDADFHRRLATLVPADEASAGTWLKGVSLSLEACHPAFALWAAGWLARQHRAIGLPETEEHLWLLAAWAWHADQPMTVGHRLVRRMWTPQISLRRALEELSGWRQRMVLATLLDAESGDRWLTPGSALDYEFVPLISADDFVLESEKMSNCLDQYADRFARNFSRIFAVRKNGRSVANVEIGLDDQDGRMPAILQLRGPRNRRTSAELWRAVYLWLGSQPLKPRTAMSTKLDPEKIDAASQNIWAPYLEKLKTPGRDTAFQLSLNAARVRPRRLARKPQQRRGALQTDNSEQANELTNDSNPQDLNSVSPEGGSATPTTRRMSQPLTQRVSTEPT